MSKGKASPMSLSADERQELESLGRRRSTAQALALRARIVLAAAEDGHNGEVAGRLGIFRGMVGKWRERFGSTACTTSPAPVLPSDRRRRDCRHDPPPAGDAPGGRHAQALALDGTGGWPCPVDDPPDLEGVRPAAAS